MGLHLFHDTIMSHLKSSLVIPCPPHNSSHPLASLLPYNRRFTSCSSFSPFLPLIHIYSPRITLTLSLARIIPRLFLESFGKYFLQTLMILHTSKQILNLLPTYLRNNVRRTIKSPSFFQVFLTSNSSSTTLHSLGKHIR